MRSFPKLLMIVGLALAAWQVHRVRGALASGDADPVAVARLQARLAGLPRTLADGRYLSRPLPIDPDLVRMAGADTYLSLVYTDAAQGRYQLYVGGSIASQENFHAPSCCMPATGWETLEQSSVPFPAPGARRPDDRVRRLLLQRGSERMVVYFWFVAGALLADNEWAIRWLRFRDLLADRPFRPTLIVTVYAPVVRSVAETERELGEFLGILGPPLHAATEGDD